MAHLRTPPEAGLPYTIARIKQCLEDPHIGGRVKRDRLAAIASRPGSEVTNKPWVGHVLALLCESLEASVINEIMTSGPGRYKKEWDKWKLGEGLLQWLNKRGEDTIRNLVYDLLMHDLILLYQGQEVDGGVGTRSLSVKGVCKKVKDEIGIVVIKDSYLREQLELHGVLRNQNRQTTGRKGRNTQSVSSPSTLGHPTPTSIPMPSVSPRLNTLGRLSPGSSHVPSSLPTPIRHAPDSSGISSSPNTAAATQRPSHSQLPKSTTSYQQSRTNKPSNINSFLQKPQQDSRDTALPLYSSGYLDPTPMSGDEGFTGTATEPHNDRYITGSAPAGSWSIAEQAALTEQATLVCNPTSNVEDTSYTDHSSNNYNPSDSLPLVLTAEPPSNPAFTQMFQVMKLQMSENMELLTRRLDAERDAYVKEAKKWQRDYTGLGKSYQALTVGYEELSQKSDYLKGLCRTLEHDYLSEQTKREKLSDDMETMQQRYHSLDATVQKLTNDNLELQSKVLSLESEKGMRVEHINNLETSLEKLEAENSELRTDLSTFHGHNDTLRTEVTKLQIDNNQLIGGIKRIKVEKVKIEKNIEAVQQQKDNIQKGADKLQAENVGLYAQIAQLKGATLEEKHKNERTIEALQQEKDSLQNETDVLQVENAKLYAQISQLQEAKASLDEKVDLLESECASLREESKTLNTNLAQKSQAHLSNMTIDSAMGESIRASVASSSARKRQISITEEREEKRQRSVHFVAEEVGTFFAEPDPDELPIMGTSELPIRSGSEASVRSEGGWV